MSPGGTTGDDGPGDGEGTGEPADRWARIEELFSDAVELPPGDRTSFLEDRCAEETDLLAEVLSLVRSHEEPGVVPELAIEAEDAPPPLPDRIGDYRVVRALGEGGMGIVLLAVREGEGFEQTVALKLIRGAFADPRLRERLESERRILARLEHPGIARLIDGGWTDERQPFFAMEYVPGEDILTYSDSRRLGVEERLSLFAEVCEAVHYAHQQLVVHRDLKPSNILVTAEGRPKLLDFGIAKGLEAAEGEGQTERWVTPAYASPEQVSAGVVSTLSDVYALGVLLCELLVGVKPYPISGATPSEISRVVAEVEPTRPSVLATRDPDGEGGGGPRDHVPISGVPHRLV